MKFPAPETIKAYREAIGGRRFIMVMGAGVVTSALVFCGKIDVGAYVTLQLATIGAYVAANTTERIKGTPDQKPAL